ncbi:MAG TPA: DMT family transporter [Cyclobacteriaceae bacterium]|jgi:transporter family-2 protein|nr:DMT family transporter [Cyclobacteriaceae bacterium]
MKSSIIYLGLALITGALIPIQASTNATFSKAIGNPLTTGVMVFVVGFFAMVVVSIAMRASIPTLQQLGAAPWYGYAGGVIVATYVVMITILVPQIGVGTAIALIVTGQIFCAIIIDHFGFFGVQVRTVDFSRAAGILFMVTGVYLIMRK